MLLMKVLLSSLIVLSGSIVVMRLVYYSSSTITTNTASTTTTTTTRDDYSTCIVKSLSLYDDDDDSALPQFTEEDYSKLIVVTDDHTTVTCDSCDDPPQLEYCEGLVGCNFCFGVGIYNATTVKCGCDCVSSTIINAETVHCSGGCGGTTIQNATTVYCNDSCRSTGIQASKVVECSGTRSCQFSEIQASVVECSGPESCWWTTIHAQHVVCNGTCGATSITSACLECNSVNNDGGCEGHLCFWNGEPCPTLAPKTCVVGASVKATGGRVVNQQIISSPGQRGETASNYTKMMVEVNVEADQRDRTLFHGTVQLIRQEDDDVDDDFTPFKTFDSTSILLSYVQNKECVIIKGRGKVDESASDKYEFSMKLCEEGHNTTTMSMTIDKPPMRRYSLYVLPKAILEGTVDVKYQNFDSVEQAAIF